jgi:branched-chain amino acid aminotransferase
LQIYELVSYEKATVHFLTPAQHYGAAVFKGIRSYDTARGPAIFRAREHAERLLESAEVFGFRSLPWTAKELVAAFCDTVRVNGFGECYIRPLIYLTDGGWNLNMDGGKPLT